MPRLKPTSIGHTDFEDLDEFWISMQIFCADPLLQRLVSQLDPGNETAALKAADPEYQAKCQIRLRMVFAVARLLQASADHQVAGPWKARDHQLTMLVAAALNPSPEGHAAAMQLFNAWWLDNEDWVLS